MSAFYYRRTAFLFGNNYTTNGCMVFVGVKMYDITLA